jgi:molybdopterin molybdotransferase
MVSRSAPGQLRIIFSRINAAPAFNIWARVRGLDRRGNWRILAEDVVAAGCSPFDNSAMDGYAVRAGDLERGLGAFACSGRVEAGCRDAPRGSRRGGANLHGAALPQVRTPW